LADFLVSLSRHHPELTQLMLAWRRLPKAIRQGILAMVRTASGIE
jgi:predicted metal-binding protein